MLATTALSVAGYFTAFTYVVAFLIEVSGFTERAVSPLLLGFGVADLIGTILAGVLADRYPRLTMVFPVALMTAALLGLYAFGPVPLAAAVLVGLTGLGLAVVPTAMQSRIMQVAPAGTDVASAGNSAAFNLGIAGGSLLGGVLLPAYGVRSTALAGALVTAVALLVVLSEPLVTRRPAHAVR